MTRYTYHPVESAEKVAVSWLTSQGINAVSELPAKPTFPCLMIHRMGGQMDSTKTFDQADLQLDSWGTSKQEAWYQLSAALTALWALPSNSTLAEVLDVQPNMPVTWLPDDSVTPPRPRYLAGVQVTLR